MKPAGLCEFVWLWRLLLPAPRLQPEGINFWKIVFKTIGRNITKVLHHSYERERERERERDRETERQTETERQRKRASNVVSEYRCYTLDCDIVKSVTTHVYQFYDPSLNLVEAYLDDFFIIIARPRFYIPTPNLVAFTFSPMTATRSNPI